MVQISFDTNADSLDELQHALHLLQQTVARREGALGGLSPDGSSGGSTAGPPSLTVPSTSPAVAASRAEQTAGDTPVFKITLKDSDANAPGGKSMPPSGAPSLNQLLSDDTLTEDELSRMFTEHGGKAAENGDVDERKADERSDVRTGATGRTQGSAGNAAEDAGKKEEKEDAQPCIEIIEYTDEQ